MKNNYGLIGFLVALTIGSVSYAAPISQLITESQARLSDDFSAHIATASKAVELAIQEMQKQAPDRDKVERLVAAAHGNISKHVATKIALDAATRR